MTYIGAKRAVGWHEATTFASAFYGAYFKDRGKGLSPTERGRLAAERAVAGYEAIVAGSCPYKPMALDPSRAARRSLSG